MRCADFSFPFWAVFLQTGELWPHSRQLLGSVLGAPLQPETDTPGPVHQQAGGGRCDCTVSSLKACHLCSAEADVSQMHSPVRTR